MEIVILSDAQCLTFTQHAYIIAISLNLFFKNFNRNIIFEYVLVPWIPLKSRNSFESLNSWTKNFDKVGGTLFFESVFIYEMLSCILPWASELTHLQPHATNIELNDKICT